MSHKQMVSVLLLFLLSVADAISLRSTHFFLILPVLHGIENGRSHIILNDNLNQSSAFHTVII